MTLIACPTEPVPSQSWCYYHESGHQSSKGRWILMLYTGGRDQKPRSTLNEIDLIFTLRHHYKRSMKSKFRKHHWPPRSFVKSVDLLQQISRLSKVFWRSGNLTDFPRSDHWFFSGWLVFLSPWFSGIVSLLYPVNAVIPGIFSNIRDGFWFLFSWWFR